MNFTRSDKKIVYISDLTHTSQTIALNATPYAVAGIVSYAKKHMKQSEQFQFKIFKYPETLISEILKKVPDILCFTNYCWNFDLGYSIAARTKAVNKNTITIFGGPNYPTDPYGQQKFLEKYPLIDFYVFKEGEAAFADLLNCLADNNFHVGSAKEITPNSCHFIHDGQFFEGPLIERIKDLDQIPSPYLTGELDEFFDDNLVPIIQTNRGCPFTCTFCVEGINYYNKVNKRSTTTIYNELCYIAERRRPSINSLHIADSNFGMYKDDESVAEAIASVQEHYGWPSYIHVATGKNQKERVLRVAKKINGALRLSGAVQSLSPTVLENIKRNNIKENDLIELAHKAKDLGSNTYSEIIVGLPGETKDTHLKTIETVVNAKFNYVRIYTLMLLAGVDMSSTNTREAFQMESKYRVLPRCFGIYHFGDGAPPILSAETEEVCIGTKDMPYKDYLASRLFHLTVEIFYNDSIASELVEFLNLFDVPVSEWLKNIHDRLGQFPDNLKMIYDKFLQETQNELWPTKEDLLGFVKNEDTIQKFLTGEYGSNLIFKYKALSLMSALGDVINVAYDCAKELLGEKSPIIIKKYSTYLDDLKQYSILRKVDLFQPSKFFSAVFHYDLAELEKRKFQCLPDTFQLPEGCTVHFRHNKKQQEVINNHLKSYGNSVVGISRILSKINVTQAYRVIHTELTSHTADREIEQREGI